MIDRWAPIRAAARDVLSRIDDFAAHAVRHVRDELPQYEQLPFELVFDAVRGSIVVAASAMRDKRSPTVQELETLRATGAERARTGVDLDGPLRALTIASRRVWEEQQEVARKLGADGDTLLEAQSRLWTLTELMGRQYIAGHREAELEMSRRDYQHRVDFVRSLLLGRADPVKANEQLVALGLDPDAEFTVCRARPVAGQGIQDLEAALVATGHSVVLVPHERDVVGLLTAPPDLAEGIVGLGPRCSSTGIPAAFGLASRALATCLRLGMTGTHEFASLGMLPAVAADRDVSSEMEHRYLLPLRTERAYDHDVELSIATYLDHGCRLNETASALHVHPNTLRQRLRYFSDLVGADLSDPAELIEVWWAFRSGRENG